MKLALSLLLLLASFSLVSAQGANVLQGKVITPSGTQPNTPVRVKLTFNGRPIHETFTDLSGRFTFPGLRSGTYQLTAEGDGLTITPPAGRRHNGRRGPHQHKEHTNDV